MKGRSLKLLSRQPDGKKVRKILRNLAVLAHQKPNSFNSDIIDRVLDITESAIRLQAQGQQSKGESAPKTVFSTPQLSKQQYVAVLGIGALTQSTIYEVALSRKFSKSNIFICDDLDSFKNGRYTEKLKSESCVAVIVGGIPHSHRENFEKEYAHKIVFARTNSGTHGKLKLTKNNLSTALDTVLQRITQQGVS